MYLFALSGDTSFEFIVDAIDLNDGDVRLLQGDDWTLMFEAGSNNELGIAQYQNPD